MRREGRRGLAQGHPAPCARQPRTSGSSPKPTPSRSWAEARRASLALTAIEPLLDALRHRLTEVATCSTLVALVLIDVLRISGHVEHAARLTDEIVAFATMCHERVYLPELLRVRGEQRESVDPAAAARDYREAIELARTMGAQSLEARAIESLATVTAR